MTIVKINKREKDVIAKTLGEANVGVNFYTIENNDSMMQAEIDTDNPGIMWHLGRAVSYAEQQTITKFLGI